MNKLTKARKTYTKYFNINVVLLNFSLYNLKYFIITRINF